MAKMNQNPRGAIKRLVQWWRAIYTDVNNQQRKKTARNHYYGFIIVLKMNVFLCAITLRSYALQFLSLHLSDNQIAYCLHVLDRESLTFVCSLLVFHSSGFFFSLSNDENINLFLINDVNIKDEQQKPSIRFCEIRKGEMCL